MFVGFMPYDAWLVLFRCTAWTHLCLVQIPAILLGLDYISRVSIGNDYIVYFRSALRMAIEDCALFQKMSDRVDGVCLATNLLNSKSGLPGNWA